MPLVSDADSWIGLDDAAERRKRQNRLHQRAWRKRREAQRAATRPHLVFIHENPRPTQEALAEHDANLSLASIAPYHDSPGYLVTALDKRFTSSNHCVGGHLVIDQLLDRLMSLTTRISADHKLLILVQYNVLRATLTNMTMLSLLHLVPRECSIAAAFAASSPFPVPSSIPPCFEPTPLQLATNHGYWIDIIPLPKMRDNIIRHIDIVSQAELCNDLVGGLYRGVDEVRSNGLIVWSDPWQAEGWEVSKGFAAKWDFLLEGCGDLLQASNKWRELRGEEPLAFEV